MELPSDILPALTYLDVLYAARLIFSKRHMPNFFQSEEFRELRKKGKPIKINALAISFLTNQQNIPYCILKRILNNSHAYRLPRKAWIRYKKTLKFTMVFPKLRCLCCFRIRWIFRRGLKGILHEKEKPWESKDVAAMKPDIPQLWKRCPTASTHHNIIFPELAIFHAALIAFALESTSKFQKDDLCTLIPSLLRVSLRLYHGVRSLSSALKQVLQKSAAVCAELCGAQQTPRRPPEKQGNASAVQLCRILANVPVLLHALQTDASSAHRDITVVDFS